MKRRTLLLLAGLATPFVALAVIVAVSASRTEREIAGHAATVAALAAIASVTPVSPEAIAALPTPVQRYLAFAVPVDFPAVKLSSG